MKKSLTIQPSSTNCQQILNGRNGGFHIDNYNNTCSFSLLGIHDVITGMLLLCHFFYMISMLLSSGL
jgi:hypothetical protein